MTLVRSDIDAFFISGNPDSCTPIDATILKNNAGKTLSSQKHYSIRVLGTKERHEFIVLIMLE